MLVSGHCKPIWLFIVCGKVVAVMHGANAPQLGKMITHEIERAKRIEAGEKEEEDTLYIIEP